MKIDFYKEVKAGDNIAYEKTSSGSAELIEGKTVIKVNDNELKQKLEKIFSEPIHYLKSNASKTMDVTIEKIAQPDTFEFFRQVKYKLFDVGLKGIIEENDFEIK
jgi:hypothetical protein